MMSRKRNGGQSLAEYLIACGVLVAMLLLPWDGEKSVVAHLAAAVRGHLRTAFYLLSLI